MLIPRRSFSIIIKMNIKIPSFDTIPAFVQQTSVLLPDERTLTEHFNFYQLLFTKHSTILISTTGASGSSV